MKSGFVEGGPRTGAARTLGPAAAITRRAADRLRAGHPWVYRSDVEGLTPALGSAEIAAGALVSVMDSRGFPLGTALYSDASQIALRMVSETTGLGREQYLADVRKRVGAALRLRAEFAPESDENNACRLIFSEADKLPGIVADKYNDLVVLQLLTQGTAQNDLRAVLASVLADGIGVAKGNEAEEAGERGTAGPSTALRSAQDDTSSRVRKKTNTETIVERPDARVRELEELAAPAAGALYARNPDAVKLATVFTINGLKFHFDAEAGQKTGAFLDQRLNYAAAAKYARGRALDVCTYQGGFALHMARVCELVTGVDASRSALEVADRNLQLNVGLAAAVDWIEADAFGLLREFEAAGERFDTVVLDPPAFAKTKRAAEGAMRGYKELNLRAMKMLRPGGTLVTCSCSHHVGAGEFMEAVTAAASDARRRVQVVETRGAAPDHPWVVTMSETNYLKCVICRVG